MVTALHPHSMPNLEMKESESSATASRRQGRDRLLDIDIIVAQ